MDRPFKRAKPEDMDTSGGPGETSADSETCAASAKENSPTDPFGEFFFYLHSPLCPEHMHVSVSGFNNLLQQLKMLLMHVSLLKLRLVLGMELHSWCIL